MLRMAPSGWEPLGFAGMGVSWLPPGRDPTGPGAAADWECTGVAPTTATNMLMRLSVMTHLHNVVVFIGSLQGFETWSDDARVLRNHLLDNIGMYSLGSKSSRFAECEILAKAFRLDPKRRALNTNKSSSLLVQPDHTPQPRPAAHHGCNVFR